VAARLTVTVMPPHGGSHAGHGNAYHRPAMANVFGE
jgi:hypothetical protein